MSLTKPDTLCMAPWTHTYLSPQTERRMCCASREPAQNFEQYIDSVDQTGKTDKLHLTTLKEHWNSDYMKSVRLKLLAGLIDTDDSLLNQRYEQKLSFC